MQAVNPQFDAKAEAAQNEDGYYWGAGGEGRRKLHREGGWVEGRREIGIEGGREGRKGRQGGSEGS
jgi:hypothetical protein